MTVVPSFIRPHADASVQVEIFVFFPLQTRPLVYKMTAVRATLALVVAMIFFGSLNTLVRKAQLVTCASSSFPVDPSLARECADPTQEPFNKPWIGNMFMFIGEVMLFAAVRVENKQRARSPISSLPQLPWYYFAIPASLDVLGSGLSGVSMLFISASVWQMLRGSMIIYTAILSVMFLGKKLESQHITGLLLASLGLTLVGVSAYLDTSTSSSVLQSADPSSSLVVVGIGLTVLSQLCSAVQVVVEESLLKSTAGSFESPSPARVVAFEGLCGLVIMIVVLAVMQLASGPDHGSFENSVDSMEKIASSGFLFTLVVVYCVSIALFNHCGMAVSKYLSSLHRTLIDSLRAVVVWGAQLAMFYLFDSSTYGIAWTANSLIQLAGFAVLVLGTLVYNEIIIIFKRPAPESIVEQSDELRPMIATTSS